MNKDVLSGIISSSFIENTENLKKEIDEKLEEHRNFRDYSFDIKVPPCTAEVLKRQYTFSIAKCTILSSFNNEKMAPETTLHFEMRPYPCREAPVKAKSQIDTLIRECIEKKMINFRLVIVPAPIIPLEEIQACIASEYPFLACDAKERKQTKNWSEDRGEWVDSGEERVFLDLFISYKAN